MGELYLAAQASSLLHKVVEKLAGLSHGMLQKTWVVLPTKRLETYLVHSWLTQHKTIVMPRFLSLDQFVSRSLPSLEVNKTHLSALAEEQLLREILAVAQWTLIKPGHEHELLQLFAQMTQVSKDATSLESLKDKVSQDVYRDENYKSSLSLRIDEVSACLLTFQERLRAHGLVASYEYPKLQTEALLKHWDFLQDQEEPVLPKECEHLILAGFTTCTPFYKPLLSQLAMQPNVSFFLSNPLDIFSSVNPLTELQQVLAPYVSKNELEIIEEKREDAQILLHSCSSQFGEVQKALQLVKNYIAQEVSPKDIAILVTEEARYVQWVKTFLSYSETSVNLSLGQNFGTSKLGRFFSLLMSAVREPFNLILKRSIEQQPLYQQCLLDSQLSQLSLIQPSNHGKKKQLLAEYLKQLDVIFHFIQESGEFAEDQVQALEEIIDGFYEFSNLSQNLWTLVEFGELFSEAIRKKQLRSVGFPLKEVQVLRFIECRYIPFKVAIVLGCVEGYLPKAYPFDRILDDYFKVQLGLPGWKYVEALEDTTFMLLRQNTQALHLLYPRQVEGQPVVASRFVEQLLASEEYIGYEEEHQIKTPYYQKTDDLQLQSIFSKGNVQLEPDQLRKISAYSAEDLLLCPYRYLLSQLKVKEMLWEKPEAMEEGALLHKVLQYFQAQEQSIFPESIPKAEFQKTLLERVLKITEEVAPEWKTKPLYWHLKYYAWPKYLEFIQDDYQLEGDVYRLKPRRSLQELSFHQSGHAVFWEHPELKAANMIVQLQGVLDCLHLYQNDFQLIDYKRRYDPLKNRATGLPTQLLFYLLAIRSIKPQLVEGSTSGTAGFYGIIEGKWHSQGTSPRGMNLDQMFLEFQSQLVKGLVSHSKGAPFVPKVSAACQYCEHQGLCRSGEPGREDV